MPFAFICLIYVIGVILLFVEVFLPGIIIGLIGSCIVISSFVFAFQHHPPIYGISLIVVSILVIPTMFVWGIRRLTLQSAQNVEEGYTSVAEGSSELLGQEGKTLSPLRPSGIARINNRRVDVVSENVMIDEDVPVKVVKVEGNQVVVRKI